MPDHDAPKRPTGEPSENLSQPPSYDTSKDNYAGIANGGASGAQGAEAARDFAEMIVDTAREGLLVLDLDLRVQAANESFYRTFEVTPDETLGQLVYDLGSGQWDIPELRELLEGILPQRKVFNDYEVEHDFDEIGRRHMLLNARQMNAHQLILLAIEDVTERRRGEQALAFSEEQRRLLIENATEYAIFTMDTTGTITSWSAGAERIFGYTKEEAVGQPGTMIFTPEQCAAGVPQHEMRVAREEGTGKDERWHQRKDHSCFWGSGVMVALGEEELRGFAKILRDNTEHKEAEEALRTSEERYRTLFESIDEGFCIVEVLFEDGEAVDYRFLETNPAFEQQTGLQDAEGRRIRELVPQHEGHWYETYGRVARTGEATRFTSQTEHLGGRIYDVYAFRIGAPEERKVAILFRDVTKEKRAEEALRDSEARLRRFADAAPAILWVTEPDGRCTYLSQDWYDYTGLSEGSSLGFGWLEAVHPEDVEATRAAFLEANERRAPFRQDYRIRRHDGTYRWAIDAGEPYFGDEGVFLGIVGSVIDIHDRKEAEEALRELSEELEARVRERTRQVRELASTLTLAEQRERRHLSQILHDDLQQLLYGLEMKMKLVDHALAGGNEAAASHVAEAKEWLRDCVEITRNLTVDLSPPVLKSEGLTDTLMWLQSQMEEVHGLEVELDAGHAFRTPEDDLRVLVYQIVRELLFNVVKHAGVERATVELRDVDHHVEIVVADEGAGFDVEAAESRDGGGFGLFSARERLGLFGGEMEIDSAPGAGTRVRVSVPLQLGGAAPSDPS